MREQKFGKRESVSTLILGHRGASKTHPENSLSAFEASAAAGADGIELDIQRSADGVPVVIHDATLDRTTSGRGLVSKHTASALSRLDAGDGQGVPTLEAVVEWAEPMGQWLNVELKATGVEDAVLNVLREAQMMERVILSSFSVRTVANLSDRAPDARRFLLFDEARPTLIEEAKAAGANGICLRDDLATDRWLLAIRDADLPVVIWTVDDAHRIRELLEARVHGLITNDPALAVSIREDLEAERG